MSQLRKSASFRSRIPVRRTRVPQRRCCSPPGVSTSVTNLTITDRTVNTTKTTPTTTTTAIKSKRSNPKRTKQQQQLVHSNSRYSSSSFSSSDESFASEAPLQALEKKIDIAQHHGFYTSTDAISLDGLLDSISTCGSFSSPPSPTHYQNTNRMMHSNHSSSYESLDKYNAALEQLQITDNYNHFQYPVLRQPNQVNLTSSENNLLQHQIQQQQQYKRSKKNNSQNVSQNSILHDDTGKNHHEQMKQQLNDWYHIKNNRNSKNSNVIQGQYQQQQLKNHQNHTNSNEKPFNTVTSSKYLSSHAKGLLSPSQEQLLLLLPPPPTAEESADVIHQNLLRNHPINHQNLIHQQHQHQQQRQQNRYCNNNNVAFINANQPLTLASTIPQSPTPQLSTAPPMENDSIQCNSKKIIENFNVQEFVHCYNKQHQYQLEPEQNDNRENRENIENRTKNTRRRDDNLNLDIADKFVSRNILKKQLQRCKGEQFPRNIIYDNQLNNIAIISSTESEKTKVSSLPVDNLVNQYEFNNDTIDAMSKLTNSSLPPMPLGKLNSSVINNIDLNNGVLHKKQQQQQHQHQHHHHQLQKLQAFHRSNDCNLNDANNFDINRKMNGTRCSFKNINRNEYNSFNRCFDQQPQRSPRNLTDRFFQNNDDFSNNHLQQQYQQYVYNNGQNIRMSPSSVAQRRKIIQVHQQLYQTEPKPKHHQFPFNYLSKGINSDTNEYNDKSNIATVTTGLQKHFATEENQTTATATTNATRTTSSFEQLNIIGIPTKPHLEIYENNRIVEWNNEQYRNGNVPVSAEGKSSSSSTLVSSNSITATQTTTSQSTNNDAKIVELDKTLDTNNTTIETNDLERKYQEAKRRPLPQLPLQDEIFPPKTSSSYRSDCELSGSYVSLECPSPPGPPTCLPESRRDPQARLSNYLKTLYTDLALKEPIIPPWAIPVAPGSLSPARLEPEIHLNVQSHGFSDSILIDQLLSPIHTKEGAFLEAPRRVLIECPPWSSRTNLSLRILYAWAKEPPWPPKGTPVALTIFIPLCELKRSFSNYVEKELLLKGPLNPFASGFGGFTAAWNSLESLGPKLLILLDGYDTQKGSPKRKGKHYPPDVYDLLDGKIFPEARVILTTSITNCTELLPLVQRHVIYDGMTWGRSASLLGGGQWGAAPARLLDTVQECNELRKIVRTPLGCLAIAAIYEATAGDLPTDELDVIESVLNCVAPETSSVNVAELGRLALFCLKMKRPCITVSEIRMYCSSPESSILNCLDKGLLLGKSARKKGELTYNPMCPGMAEFLAANYIASLANRPGLLAAEITGLSIGDELEPELLKVIKFAMGLLGPRAHILLSKLTPLWLTPQNIFSFALAGGSSEDNLSALCDIIGISKHPPISPLEAKPLWVQVRSAPIELMGWGMALKSPTCTLKNLELIYQLEKHTILDSRNAMESFLDSIELNESVSTLRITSLIENDVKDAEINYLANCVSKALLKPRLESFELILTLLEEDPPILKLQPVVSALCRAIPRQPKLNCLQLDLGFSTSQLVQLCTTLDKCPNITRLSLPHLRCERGAISALAALLAVRPMSFLALPSCWGARDDPPSSSGVSMGSGSGSSTGTSGLIKQGSLTGVPSPRSYPPGLFSSLPRGMYVPTATMGRSATLPRQPMEPPADKRSCDSVVSKTWFPTPACDGGPHNSGTLHDLLLAAREPYSKLHGLDLSKAQLSLEDSMCLGETVRLSNTLHTLKLEGSSRLSEILPSVLGASESPCLQMLSIGSQRLNLEDSAIAMSARALTSCSTLRLLSLDGWSFRIENPSTLSILRAFLSLTSLRELSLANCRLQIGIFKSDSKIINSFESRSVVVLKLASAQITLADSVLFRGPQLLPFINGFPCLREIDLSAPARSGLGSTTHSTPLILDDKCLLMFFQSLHSYFSLLNTLKMCNWVIHFDDPSKSLKTLSKCMRNSPISHLKLDGISVLDRPKKLRIESQLIHTFISSLPLLRWMGISLSGKKEDQITAIGNAVLDLKGYEIDIKLSESTIEHAKLMAQAISLDGKFDIKVSTFGTSSGILIHAEKSGTKSLSRKHKE